MTKIIIAGDFSPTAPVVKLINNNQFSEVFGNVKATIESADYAVVNFECPVVLSEAKPIEKTDPNL